MIHRVTFHIPGEIDVDAGSPEEAEKMVGAMDASELAPALGSTVVDEVREPPAWQQTPASANLRGLG